jgi:hypothetical protein
MASDTVAPIGFGMLSFTGLIVVVPSAYSLRRCCSWRCGR